MIVTPLKAKDDPGNTADAKYEKVVLKYEDQEEGKPYITAEFSKGLFTTEFPVGDGKYYSRNGVTNPKRKRRAAGKLALNLWVTLLFGVKRYVTPNRAWFRGNSEFKQLRRRLRQRQKNYRIYEQNNSSARASRF